MPRRPLRSLALALLMLPLLAAGCVTENPSLVILGGLVPTQEEGQCFWNCSAGSGNVFDNEGSFDLTLAQRADTGYFLGVCVANYRSNTGTRFAADTGTVVFSRANVTLRTLTDRTLLEYGVPFAGSVMSTADVSTPSVAAVRVTLIPPEVRESLLADSDDPDVVNLRDLIMMDNNGGNTVIAEFTLVGRTAGGIEVESAPFDYPIELFENQLACQTPTPEDEQAPCAAGVDGILPVLDGSQLEIDLEGARGEPLFGC